MNGHHAFASPAFVWQHKRACPGGGAIGEGNFLTTPDRRRCEDQAVDVGASVCRGKGDATAHRMAKQIDGQVGMNRTNFHGNGGCVSDQCFRPRPDTVAIIAAMATLIIRVDCNVPFSPVRGGFGERRRRVVAKSMQREDDGFRIVRFPF